MLTLLIHLGYLAYDETAKTARILNEEIRMEFSKAVRETGHTENMKRVAESDRLIYDTVYMNVEAVAAQIEKIHSEETDAYYTYKDYYLQWEELSAGDGYTDIIYLPRHFAQKGMAIHLEIQLKRYRILMSRLYLPQKETIISLKMRKKGIA